MLKDRWHLDALLGAGGMAWVFAATHRNKNRVAIKLLQPHLSVLPDIRRRFQREGYAANSINHPCAVRVFDDDVTDDGLAFLVMELLEGKTLSELRREAGGRLDPRTALRYADKVLDVLVAAHERGVIHRDLKPGNIFVTRDGTPKVLDFGIARVCEVESGEEATQTGLMLGSAAYMPPEQALGRWDLVDARTDLWSLGAGLFQLLSGRAVHEGSTPQERLRAAMTERARSLSSVVPGMPQPVVDLVNRALTHEREGRWQSAWEMQTSLRSVLAGLGDLGATLFVGAPPPEISSPEASPAPLLLAEPTVRVHAPATRPAALASTLVLGSDPLASLGPLPDPGTEPLEPPNAPRDTAPPEASAGPRWDPPSAPTQLDPPHEGSRPTPTESRSTTITRDSTAEPGRVGAAAPRRSPALLAAVITLVVAAALLALVGFGISVLRREAARRAEPAAMQAATPPPAAPVAQPPPTPSPTPSPEALAGPPAEKVVEPARSAAARDADPRKPNPSPVTTPQERKSRGDPYSVR